MVDRCEVVRFSGEPVTNPDGTVTRPSEVVYDGPCKVQSSRPWPTLPDAGEHQWTVNPLEVHFPVAADVRTGDVITVSDSLDPLNIGRVLRVTSGDRKSYQTALRVRVEEVTG